MRMLWLDSKSNRPIEYDREVFLLRSIPLHAFEQLEFMLLEMASQGFEKVLAEQKIDTELREASRVLMLPGNMIQGYGYIGVLVSPAFKACDFAVEGPGAWCGFIRDEADISLGARERAGLDVPVQPFSRH